MIAPSTVEVSLPEPGPILLAVHQGFAVRYVIQTQIFRRLLSRGEKVVVVVSPREFEYVRAIVPPDVPVVPAPPIPTPGRLQRYLQILRHVLHPTRVSSAEESYRRRIEAAPTGLRRLVLRLLYHLAKATAMARPLRMMIPRFEATLEDGSAFRTLLTTIVPSLVVVTSTGRFGYDAPMLRAASALRVPVTTVILSWDNTTTTGYPAGFGDCVVAWTEVMKDEICRFLDYRPEQVAVLGVAHFDVYHTPDPEYDRSAVLRQLGLDANRRTIVLATKSPNAYLCNPLIAECLAAAIADGSLPSAQLVIRVHPLHYWRDGQSKLIHSSVLQSYQTIADTYPHVVLSEPLVIGNSPGQVMADDEMLRVARLLRSADVLVSMFSTINIEAALLDKPIVNVCFELTASIPPGTPNPERYNISSDAAENHNMRIIDSGGTRIAYSPEELIEHVMAYLTDPSLDAQGRRTIAEREGGPFKGSAGNAIADYIIHTARRKRRQEAVGVTRRP